MAKIAVFGYRNGPKYPYHISHEPLIPTPHSNFSSHFCISVWYNIYPLLHQKWLPFLSKKVHLSSCEPLFLVLDIIHTLQSTENGWNGCLWLKKCPKRTNVVSLELLLIWRWLTTYFDHITPFLFGASEVAVIDPIG